MNVYTELEVLFIFSMDVTLFLYRRMYKIYILMAVMHTDQLFGLIVLIHFTNNLIHDFNKIILLLYGI
jgi:hypothetical protein